MKGKFGGGSPDPGLAKSALIRELVDLSRFTDGILRTMGSAVVAVDGEGSIVYINPAAEALLLRPARDLLRRPASEILVTRGGGNLVSFGLEVPSSWGEVDLELPGDRAVTVDARLTRHLDEEGRDDGFVAILTDLTDVKRAEEQARRKERLASLGELSAGVAHEIRNPLAGIAASAQILQRRIGEDPDRSPLVAVILEEVARLDRIVESLLEFARPPQPRLRKSDVVACVGKALDLVEETARERSLHLERAHDEDLPEIWIDPEQIEQVCLNLVRNAMDALEAGGTLAVAVRLVKRRPYVRRSRGRRRDDRGLPPESQPLLMDWIEIEIRDDGHGMTSEVLDRIFDPFYTTRSAGTGLGLPISQAIVLEHSGMITLESTVGRGTTVRVDLPVEKRQGQRRGR